MKFQSNKVYYAIIKRDKNINKSRQALDCLFRMLKYFDLSVGEINTNKYGKPYFVNSNIKFNYSHSESFIGVAISDKEVGIDIEDASRVISDEVSNRFLKGIKTNRIDSWVSLESFSKLKGIGLGIDFNSIDLGLIDNANKIIKNEEYVCSIYSDYKVTDFIDISEVLYE